MSGPWERYAAPAPASPPPADQPEAGPWLRYRAAPQASPDNPQTPRPDLPAEEDDLDSPIPTKLIQEGREILRRAEAGEPVGSAPTDYRGEGGGRGTRLEAALIGARQGVTFGFGDEINAGVRAAADWMGGKPFGEAYDSRLAHERGLLAQGREENPVSFLAGEVAGSALMPAGTAATGATVAQQAVRGAVAGAAAGGLYGFGEGEGGVENRLESARSAAAIGGAVGAAAPYVMKGARALADSAGEKAAMKAAAKAAPSADDLRAQAGALYDAAAKRGVEVKQSVVKAFADDVAATAQEAGLDAIMTPKSARAVERIQTMADAEKVSWRSIDLARRVTGMAAQSNDPNERRMAGIVMGKLDDFVMNLVDGDLEAGTAQGLSKEIAEARDLWKRMRGSERVGKAIEAAHDAASGVENGLRVEFRKLIHDEKFFRGLSPEERKAIREVVRTTPTGWVLRTVAGLSPGVGNRRNVLASLGGSAAGGTALGPVGAIAAPALGYAAEKMAGSAKMSQAELARNLIAAGGVKAAKSPAELQLLDEALRRMALPSSAAGVSALSREPTPSR